MGQQASTKALISLLDDPDETIFEQIRNMLIQKGVSIIPELEDSWENEDFGHLFQSRLEDIVHQIQFDHLKVILQNWLNSPEKDLLEGALIVAKYRYPSLEDAPIKSELKRIQKAIWLEMNEYQTGFEQVQIFNKVFYGRFGFKGNAADYYAASNSYINNVIESKKGNPLSLGIVYSIVAQSLQLPIYGVNLPNHFVLAFMDTNNLNGMMNRQDRNGVLFYINPFSNGSIFDRDELNEYLKTINKDPERGFFEPCSNSAIISRMLTNLIVSHEHLNQSQKVDELKQLKALFDLEIQID
jgi:regulator of sirC expression with transglutaminase-like and TPR domain